MKTRELSLGGKQAILKPIKVGKLKKPLHKHWRQLVQLWMSWKRKKLLGVLSHRHRTGKQQQLITGKLWELWIKTPKHQSMTSKTISTGQGWWYFNHLFEEDFESRNIEAIPQDAKHSVVRIGRRDYNLQRRTEMSHKSSETKFYGLNPIEHAFHLLKRRLKGTIRCRYCSMVDYVSVRIDPMEPSIRRNPPTVPPIAGFSLWAPSVYFL